MKTIKEISEHKEIAFDSVALKSLTGLAREYFVEEHYFLRIAKTDLDEIELKIESNSQLKSTVQVAVHFSEYVDIDNNGRPAYKKQGKSYSIDPQIRKLDIKPERDKDYFKEPFMCDTIFFDCTADYNIKLVVHCLQKKN